MNHEIDTLKELRQEKERLKLEMTIARQHLDLKVKDTFTKGKQLVAVKTSWPLVISSLAAYGAQRLKSPPPPLSHRIPGSQFNIMDGIEQGVAAMQQPGNKKWYAMLPIALKFLEQWLVNSATSESNQYRANEYQPEKHTVVTPPSSAHY